MSMKLILEGDRKVPGWSVTNKTRAAHTNVVTHPDDLSMFNSDSVCAIYAMNVLQQYPQRSVEGVLNEWRRVLKPSGILLISVPDMELICSMFSQAGTPMVAKVNLMKIAYERASSGLCEEMMRFYLRNIGITNVRKVSRFNVFDAPSTNPGDEPDTCAWNLHIVAFK